MWDVEEFKSHWQYLTDKVQVTLAPLAEAGCVGISFNSSIWYQPHPGRVYLDLSCQLHF